MYLACYDCSSSELIWVTIGERWKKVIVCEEKNILIYAWKGREKNMEYIY